MLRLIMCTECIRCVNHGIYQKSSSFDRTCNNLHHGNLKEKKILFLVISIEYEVHTVKKAFSALGSPLDLD